MLDANGNVGQIDDAGRYFQVGSRAVTQATTMAVGTGWSLVSLATDPVVPLSAPALCAALNASGGSGTAVEIDRWEAGGWEGHLCGLPINPFPLEIGRGYFVRATRGTSLTYTGTPVGTGRTASLQAGWNLVGLPGVAAQYDAPGLLAALESASGTAGTAIELDRWEAGGWEGHLRGLPVNRFAIEEGRGYFVRLARPVAWAIPGTVGTLSALSLLEATPTGTATATWSVTATPTPTGTATATATWSVTPTPAGSATATASWSVTPTPTPAGSVTPRPTVGFAASPTATATGSPAPTASATPTATTTATPTASPTTSPVAPSATPAPVANQAVGRTSGPTYPPAPARPANPRAGTRRRRPSGRSIPAGRSEYPRQAWPRTTRASRNHHPSQGPPTGRHDDD